MSNFAGQEIEGYKIQKPIGEGKFSTVYRAENKEGRTIALKKIKIFDMMDPKQRDKCLKEVKLMQPLDHPNIIKYLDSFIYNNELIIATEWAERGDLKRLIKNASQDDTPIQEVKVWDYIRQVGSALNHMHEKRIMHRDLKPANIFISSDGSLKVGDLGLGRVFSSETIEAYSKVGTPLYMSPELLHGEGYDMKSDVWSLGCIAYELCEFKSPFRNESEKMSLMDLFNNITKGEFKPISSRYSEELRDLISSMIVVDPNKRVDSATVERKANEVYMILQEQQKTPQIYCILVMEDIYEKLQLVDYHINFCAVLKRPPVSKFYFAQDDLPSDYETKFYYFAELCYWLMNLPKFDAKNKHGAALLVKKNLLYKSVEDAAKRLLLDIKAWGIKLPEQMNWVHINTGSGDTVCFILNDLLNRELIRLNFKFEPPQFDGVVQKESQEDTQLAKEEEQLEDDLPDRNSAGSQDSVEHDFMTQSIMLYNKKFNIDQPDLGDPVWAQIEASIPLDEWQRELMRVDRELTRFEMQIKINQKDSYLKDYQKSQLIYKRTKKTFDEAIHYLKAPRIQRFQDDLQDFVERIPKLEERLAQQIDPDLLSRLTEQRKQIEELKLQMHERNSEMISLAQREQSLSHELTKKQQLIEQSQSTQQQPNDLRQCIVRLKTELGEMSVRVGLKQMELLRVMKRSKSDVHNEEVSDVSDLE